MKVKELIKHLESMPQNAEVKYHVIDRRDCTAEWHSVSDILGTRDQKDLAFMCLTSDFLTDFTRKLLKDKG